MKRKIQIEFKGEIHEVIPSFAVMERIEQRFTLLDFARGVSVMNPKFSDVAWVLYSCLVENGIKVTHDDVGEYVMDERSKATESATEIIATMLDSGPEKVSKKK